MTAKSSPGFSLVELMVALVISSILLGGIMTLMSSSKKTYTLQSEFSSLQDNARFLIDELTYKIRMAGYSGCSQDPNQKTNPFAFSQNITSGSPPSDQLVIVSLGEILPLAPAQTTFLGSTTINLRQGFILPPSLSVGSTIQIVDCTIKPTPYTVEGINNNVLALDQKLANFKSRVEVFNGFQEIIYRVQADSSGLVGLYKCQDNNPNGVCDDQKQFTTPFVDGVQSMQVRYGIETSTGQIQFNPNPTTNQGENVVAVRISLLMRTPKKRGIPSTTNKIFHLDPEVTYNPYEHLSNEEGFRHRLFTTTITVRNSTI
ncbi:type IV pilus assembly protein PilW [Thioploca ingrica]|uniref:Type IV pilus assembly protein PilW n=1 Tax=Thioploca ingrica TaxID=40754 RepID=A0A090APT3_9GAMM|nr:type IV pilus assembly protein PilW [Thioploca ingrica]